MKHSILFISIIILALYSCAQHKQTELQAPKQKVGGNCEGCEAIYESTKPFDELGHVITLPGYNEAGPKLEVSGIVYKADGRTPAKDVVIYIYHTDQKGIYPTKGNEKGLGKRHGYIRGWLKTNEQGQYRFYTLRPASYPNSTNPQHIHVTVKEPDKNEYWIDEFEFEDDPSLPKKDNNRKPVGGSGILKVQVKNGVQVAARHIILGLNVQDYPVSKLGGKMRSGLAIGANCPAFDPLHLSGADTDTKACPMCKYGKGQGVMVWFNHANLDQMKTFADNMEQEMTDRGEKNFRAFLVYMNPFYNKMSAAEEKILQGKIKKWCIDQNLNKVSMVWVPSPVDKETSKLYKVNPEAKNTVFAYRKRVVVQKWVNINYDEAGVKRILKSFDNFNNQKVISANGLLSMMPYNRFK